MTSKIKKENIRSCQYCRLNNSPYCRECYDFDKFVGTQIGLEEFTQ